MSDNRYPNIYSFLAVFFPLLYLILDNVDTSIVGLGPERLNSSAAAWVTLTGCSLLWALAYSITDRRSWITSLAADFLMLVNLAAWAALLFLKIVAIVGGLRC